MPKIDHPNIGDISKTRYLTGTITEITDGDTCSLNVGGQVFESVPIFYHCSNDVTLQANGSLEGASGAFAVDDLVVAQLHAGVVRVIGHADGVKRPCAQDWQVIISVNGTPTDPADLLVSGKFTLLFRDAGSTSDPGVSAEAYEAQYGAGNAFLGYADNFVRGRTIGEDDKSDGSYDPVTKIMTFASIPKDWTPVFPETATGTYRLFNNNLFVMYPDILTGEDYVNGTVIKAGGSNPGPVFTLLGVL